MKRGDGYKPLQFAGKSLHEMLWDLMDEATAKVIDGDDSEKAKGIAIGISKCLALFTNPYTQRPKAIREEAKRRLQSRREEDK